MGDRSVCGGGGAAGEQRSVSHRNLLTRGYCSQCRSVGVSPLFCQLQQPNVHIKSALLRNCIFFPCFSFLLAFKPFKELSLFLIKWRKLMMLAI